MFRLGFFVGLPFCLCSSPSNGLETALTRPPVIVASANTVLVSLSGADPLLVSPSNSLQEDDFRSNAAS